MSDFPQSAPQPAVKADPKWFVMGGVVSIVAWLALVPLFFLIYQSFRTPGTARKPAVWTLGNYLEAYSSADTLVLFANSVEFAAGTAILALVIGTALAWMTERTNTPLKPLFYALSIIPLIIPGILFVVSWIFLASPKIGIINLVLQNLLGTDKVYVDIYSMAGMIWVDGLHYAPIAFLLMTAALAIRYSEIHTLIPMET
jgi:iron(III) transport system permease protein